MNTKADVVIISCFGRGHWLATELKSLGLEVHLVEVSDQLGRWAPEDWEGPFGLFQSENLSLSQRARLDQDASMQMNPRGLTVWTEKGPIETRGPLAGFQLQNTGLTEDQLRYLENANPSDRDRQSFRKKMAETSFRSTWFANLCHSFASNQFIENTEAFHVGYTPPVMGQHWVRRVSRRGYDQALAHLSDQGVIVHRNSKLKDLTFSSRFIRECEIESEWTGVLQGEQYIWALTSQETKRLSPRIFEILYMDSELKPQWNWQRYRVQLHSDAATVLPIHFLFLQDTGLTWTHENLMIFQQSDAIDEYDVWMRLPFTERFHRSYLEKRIKKGLQLLERRNPGISASVTQMPQEYSYDETDLGPPRLPVFTREDYRQFQRKSWINLIYDGPENWPSLDWAGNFQYQEKSLALLKKWKEDKEEHRRKLEQELKSESSATMENR